MAMIAKDGGGDFKLLEEGAHAAVCDMMADLGMQDGGSFGPKHKVYIRFQVPSERVKGEWEGEKYDRPMVTGIQLTLSLGKNSAMRPLLESWRGKAFTAEEIRGFDVTKVAGKPALINIVHEEKNGKTYANIASIMPIPKGMEVPQLEGELIVYDDDNLDNFDKLPEWLRKKIEAQIEEDDPPVEQSSRQRPQPAAFDTDLDDDVPF